MRVFGILLVLLMVSSSLGIPTRSKLLRHILSRNDGKGGRMDPVLVKRNVGDLYQRRNSLPACNTIKRSGNVVLSCRTYTTNGDKLMKCEASCPKNFEFSNGVNRKTISCIKKFEVDAGFLIQILSCKPRDSTEFAGLNKNSDRLPACHQIIKPPNSRQICKRQPGSSYENPTIQCEVSCITHYAFPDGSKEKMIVCTKENKSDDWNIIAKIPKCLPRGNELLYKSKNTERQMSLPACNSLKPPANGLITCTIDYSYEDNFMDCRPSCKENYLFADNSYGKTITCTRDDQVDAWNQYIKIPNCKERPRCRKDVIGRFQTIKCVVDKFATTCRATCMSGYTFPNGQITMIITCQKNSGIFTPVEKFPDCEKFRKEFSGIKVIPVSRLFVKSFKGE